MILQRNLQSGTWQLPEGYKDLGWQLNKDSSKEIANCIKLVHCNDGWREFDNSYYLLRCTDVVKICDKCRILWHIDMSD